MALFSLLPVIVGVVSADMFPFDGDNIIGAIGAHVSTLKLTVFTAD